MLQIPGLKVSALALMAALAVSAHVDVRPAEAQQIIRSNEIVKRLLAKRRQANQQTNAQTNNQGNNGAQAAPAAKKATARARALRRELLARLRNGQTNNGQNNTAARRQVPVAGTFDPKSNGNRNNTGNANNGNRRYALPLNPDANGNRNNNGNANNGNTRRVRSLPFNPSNNGGRGSASNGGLASNGGVKRAAPRNPGQNGNRYPTALPLDPTNTGNRGNTNNGGRLTNGTRTTRSLPFNPSNNGGRGASSGSVASSGGGSGVQKAAPRNPNRTGNRNGSGTSTSFARRNDPLAGPRHVSRNNSGGGLALTSGNAAAPAYVETGRSASPFSGGRRVITGGPSAPTRYASTDVGGYGEDVLDGEGSIDLTVHFDLDSDRITREALPVLNELAHALLDPELEASRILIAGHTDARGDNEYNLDLSNRRALAIRDFLVTQHGVEPERLEIVGYGEEDPAVDDPYDGRNRRVQIVNLGETSF
ncbi:MAG: OmpA family protein [Rhizobiales bacterium]|nr:OmpA family protein [Hyphomicrobiales bacterium]